MAKDLDVVDGGLHNEFYSCPGYCCMYRIILNDNLTNSL